MTKRYQLINGARGLDFDGGGHVAANSRGVVTLTDEQAARIKTSSAKHRYDAIQEIAPASFYPGRDDPTCACGRTLWSWQSQCSRCEEAANG